MKLLKTLCITFVLSISQLSYADYTEDLKKMLEAKPADAGWFQHQRWDGAKILAKQKFEEICKTQKIEDCKFIAFKQDFGKTLEKYGKQREISLAVRAKKPKNAEELEKVVAELVKELAKELSIMDDLETIAYDYNQLITKHKADWENKLGESSKGLWDEIMTFMAAFQREFTLVKKSLIESHTSIASGLEKLRTDNAATKK